MRVAILPGSLAPWGPRHGERAMERLLTVVRTCQLQERNALAPDCRHRRASSSNGRVIAAQSPAP